MKNAARTALVTATFVALTFAGSSTASGQVFFQGNFPVPHGQVSIGVGAPGFAIGSYVPAPYARRIYNRPSYGYGFSHEQRWVPVRRYRDRWIVIERPNGYRDRYSNRYQRNDQYDRYDRRYDNRNDRYDRRYDSYPDRDHRYQDNEDWR